MDSVTLDPTELNVDELGYKVTLNSSDTTSTMEQVITAVNRYGLPLIVVIGFIGNLLSFLVFVFSRLKRISTSVYLAALAVSDSGFLLCVGIGWFDNMGIRFFHYNGICQILVYATFVFSFTSIWFVNAFTGEMYIAVFHPKKSVKLCTVSCARKVVGALSAFAGLFYLFSFWTATVIRQEDGEESCDSRPSDRRTMMVLSVLDTVFTLLIPFTAIIFMIARLLVDITRLYNRKSDDSDANSSSECDMSGDNIPTSAKQALKAQSKLKKMLVVVVIVFLILNLPSHVVRLQHFFRSILDTTYQTSNTEIYVQHFSLILNYTNFSINVFLYSACAKSFRQALNEIAVLSCKYDCTCVKNCFSRITQFRNPKRKDTETRPSDEPDVNSRLVEIHLSEIHLSQIPSFDSGYVCRSPPCLINGHTENTNI